LYHFLHMWHNFKDFFLLFECSSQSDKTINVSMSGWPADTGWVWNPRFIKKKKMQQNCKSLSFGDKTCLLLQLLNLMFVSWVQHSCSGRKQNEHLDMIHHNYMTDSTPWHDTSLHDWQYTLTWYIITWLTVWLSILYVSATVLV